MARAQSGDNSHLAFETARPSQAREASVTISNPTMNILGDLSVMALIEQPYDPVKVFHQNATIIK
jgi:hypothetical protein